MTAANELPFILNEMHRYEGTAVCSSPGDWLC